MALRYRFVPALMVPLLSAASPAADNQHLGRFSQNDLSGWEEKVFRRKTLYELVSHTGGKTVLMARSRDSASGLVRKVRVDPAEFPVLRWSWKVEGSLKREDVSRKAGDDFAARVYVVFPRTFFWQTRAINYVWSSSARQNIPVPSPYTSNAMTIPVETGDEKAGTWVTEERDIAEDYRELFGDSPPLVGAVAVMTDTDDTHDEATAWYGDIYLERSRQD